MLTAVILEDEIRTRDTIVKIIEQECYSIKVVGVAGDIKTALNLIETFKPDILACDIELSDGTAFDLLKKIKNITFQIIFITAHEGYALKAIKFSAFDFILKPFSKQELVEVFDNVEQKALKNKTEASYDILLQHIDKKNNKKIVLKTLSDIHIVDTSHIIFCKADSSYTQFNLIEKKQLIVSGNLKNFEDLLDRHDFLRVHHSYLVNINHIKQFHRLGSIYLCMVDGTHIPVSSRKKEHLIDLFNKL